MLKCKLIKDDKLDHARLFHIYSSIFPIGILSVEQMVAEFFNVEVQANQGSMQLLGLINLIMPG